MRIDLAEVSGGYVKCWPPVTECEPIHYPQRYVNVRMNGSETARGSDGGAEGGRSECPFHRHNALCSVLKLVHAALN